MTKGIPNTIGGVSEIAQRLYNILLSSLPEQWHSSCKYGCRVYPGFSQAHLSFEWPNAGYPDNRYIELNIDFYYSKWVFSAKGGNVTIGLMNRFYEVLKDYEKE